MNSRLSLVGAVTRFALLGLLAGCAPSPAPLPAASTQQKPLPKAASSQDADSAGADSAAGRDDGGAGLALGIRMTGDIKVSSGSGADLCTGSATILARVGGKAGFGFTFPEGHANCMGIKIDLTRMMAAFAKNGPLSGKGETMVKAKGGVIYAEKFFGAAFDPPRPFMVGPVLQDMSKYKGLDQKATYTATIPDPKTHEPKTGTGEIEIKVLETAGTIDRKIAGVDGALDQVLHFQMTSTGFDGVDKMSGFLFDNVEMFINARPLSFPRFIVESPMEDLMGSGIISGDTGMIGIASALVGSLRIEFNMTAFQAESP